MSLGLERVLQWANDVLRLKVDVRRIGDVLRERAAGDGERVADDEAALDEILEQTREATGLHVEVLLHVLAGWLEVREERRLRGDVLEVVYGELDLCSARDREQV